ncbi:MAG: alpha/beta fold hydrolase [Polyangia bacterium]
MILERHGARLGYDVRGEGPAVLLLHPFPFDRRFFGKLSLPGFRLIALDARGFGESELHGGITIDELADDAVALLDHLGIPMAALLGSSMGGYVALSVAARHPARLSALVLAGTRAGGDSETARANRDAAATEIHAHGPARFLDGVSVRLCGRSTSAAIRNEVQKLAAHSSPDFARALPAMMLALRDRPDRSELVDKLHLPTLVVVGEDDSIVPPDEARALKKAIPGAQLAELVGAGHLPSIEIPCDFERVVSAFLEATLASG